MVILALSWYAMQVLIQMLDMWCLMDSKKQQDRQREVQYVQYQQYSINTCIVYNISNELFMVLSPYTTQNFKFIQHCIFILHLALLPPKLPI